MQNYRVKNKKVKNKGIVKSKSIQYKVTAKNKKWKVNSMRGTL